MDDAIVAVPSLLHSELSLMLITRHLVFFIHKSQQTLLPVGLRRRLLFIGLHRREVFRMVVDLAFSRFEDFLQFQVIDLQGIIKDRVQ